MDVNNLFFKTLVMHVAGGILSAQANPDYKFIDSTEKKKEEHFADQVMLFSSALMKRLEKLDRENEEKNG